MTGSRFNRAATGVLHAHRRRASAQNVHCCIRVGVRGEPAMSASETGLALSARFIDDAAFAARLACVGGIDLCERPAALFQLVSQDGHKCRPTLFQNTSIEAALPASLGRHSNDVQILQRDVPEPARDVGCRPVPPIGADADDFCGDTRQSRPLLSVAIGAAPATGEHPLRFSLPALKSRRVGRGQQFARGQRQRVRHAPVNADARQDGRARFVLNFAGEGRIPCASHAGHRDVTTYAPHGASVANLHPTEIRNAEMRPAVIAAPEPNLSEGAPETVVGSSPSESWKSTPSREEVRERLIKIANSLLERRDRRGSNPVHLAAKLRQLFALRGKIETPARTPPIAPLFERQIIDKAGCANELRQPFSLRFRGVEPVAKCPLNHASFLPHCEVEMKEIAA